MTLIAKKETLHYFRRHTEYGIDVDVDGEPTIEVYLNDIGNVLIKHGQNEKIYKASNKVLRKLLSNLINLSQADNYKIKTIKKGIMIINAKYDKGSKEVNFIINPKFAKFIK